MLNSSRGLGYKPDPHDARDHLFGKTGAPLSPPILREPDQEAYVQRVRHQLKTSSCVGNAFAGAGEICSAIIGRPCHLSASWPYVIGVEAERPEYRGGLLDDGSYPRLVMSAVQKRGLLSERARPFSEAEVVKRPVPNEAAVAFDAAGLRYYRIDETGEARIAAIEDALRRGYGVLFGMRVSEAYQGNEGELVRDMDGPIAGGHMQVCTAIRRAAGIARVLNSWGVQWGDRGFANFDLGFFADAPMTDIYAITWFPEVSDA